MLTEFSQTAVESHCVFLRIQRMIVKHAREKMTEKKQLRRKLIVGLWFMYKYLL